MRTTILSRRRFKLPVGLCLGSLLAIWLSSCGPNGPSPPKRSTSPHPKTSEQAEHDAAPSKPKAPTPLEQARSFMTAMRTGTTASLAPLVALPFAFRDTGTEIGCTSGDAESEAQVAGLLQCLFDDRLLQEELNANPEPLIEEVAIKDLPDWTKPWRAKAASDKALSSVYVPGNGVAFFFIVLSDERGVRGLWKHATFDPN